MTVQHGNQAHRLAYNLWAQMALFTAVVVIHPRCEAGMYGDLLSLLGCHPPTMASPGGGGRHAYA